MNWYTDKKREDSLTAMVFRLKREYNKWLFDSIMYLARGVLGKDYRTGAKPSEYLMIAEDLEDAGFRVHIETPGYSPIHTLDGTWEMRTTTKVTLRRIDDESRKINDRY